jgi:hypothetical protein
MKVAVKVLFYEIFAEWPIFLNFQATLAEYLETILQK